MGFKASIFILHSLGKFFFNSPSLLFLWLSRYCSFTVTTLFFLLDPTVQCILMDFLCQLNFLVITIHMLIKQLSCHLSCNTFYTNPQNLFRIKGIQLHSDHKHYFTGHSMNSLSEETKAKIVNIILCKQRVFKNY